MTYSDFALRVEKAVEAVRKGHVSGEITDDQVRRATVAAGLPVSFRDESFMQDPVRRLVAVRAVCSPPLEAMLACGATKEAWQWSEEALPRIMDLTEFSAKMRKAVENVRKLPFSLVTPDNVTEEMAKVGLPTWPASRDINPIEATVLAIAGDRLQRDQVEGTLKAAWLWNRKHVTEEFLAGL